MHKIINYGQNHNIFFSRKPGNEKRKYGVQNSTNYTDLSLSPSLSPPLLQFLLLLFSFYHDLLQHPGLKILLLYRFLFSFPLSFYFFYNLFYAIGDTVRCNEDSLLFTRCQRYFLCQSSFARIQIFIYFAHKKFIACIL